MLSNVNSTVAQVLSPFSHPDLVDAFSGGETEGEADLTALLSGAIYFVSLPMTLFGKEGARYAYMLIKLRFMSLMRERRTRKEWNQETPVGFICDEYQAICDSVTDTDFWDKSRSSGCFGIVSMQGVASLLQAVGSKQTADAILQNFRQRLIFRTEDDATMSMVQRLLGQVDVLITSTSDGSSSGVSSSQQGAAIPLQWGTAGPGNNSFSEGNSYSESTSLQRQQLFDANDFRRLSTDYGLFIGNLGDRAVDEVIYMQPLFVKE
jgi:type IV secretory pathway TraG/TraD family ATPase VirD4